MMMRAGARDAVAPPFHVSHPHPLHVSQALATLSSLSESPVNAVALASTRGAVNELFNLLNAPEPTAASAALRALGNLCKLGSLPAEPLRSADALARLAERMQDTDSARRSAALELIAQASLDPDSRHALVSVGAPQMLVGVLAAGGAHACHATQALAQFAADERYRGQLAAWGALPPLSNHIGANSQADARSRAAALSAVANVSYTDAHALVSAGAPAKIAELLFETDAPMLRMALSALTNMLLAPPAEAESQSPAAKIGPPLMAAGGAHALAILLGSADTEIRAHAASAAAAMASVPALVAALADAGAATALVDIVKAEGPARSGGALAAARALNAMVVNDAARNEARKAGGARALGAALEASDTQEGRTLYALTLASLLRGDWADAFEAAGWQPVLSALLAAASTASPAMSDLADAARAPLMAALAFPPSPTTEAPPPAAAPAAAPAAQAQPARVPHRAAYADLD